MKGVIELSYRSRLKVSGEQAAEFLHNICTNDIKNLRSGQGTPVAFVDKLAKIIAVASIYNFGDYFIIESDSESHQILFEHISKGAKLAGCELTNLRNSHRMFSVLGFENGVLNIDLSEKQAIKKELKGTSFIITKSCFLDRVDFMIPAQMADGFTSFLLMKGGYQELQTEDYERFRIESGIPEFGKDYDQSYMVLELGLGNLINYDKGCYTGQEIIARMKTYSGQIPKKIVTLKASGAKPKNRLFKDGLEAGIITSVSGDLCLATIKKGFFDKGTELESESGEIYLIC